MKSIIKYLSISIFISICTSLFSQKYTVSGYISDSESGEKLIGAYIVNPSNGIGTVSNSYGFYSITLSKDSVTLEYSYIGYKSITKKVLLDKNITINIDLLPSIALDAVEVIATKEEKIQDKSQMSEVSIPMVQIKKIPALLGEVDILKAFQLMPGIQSGGEGQSGLYVRGGSPDQNLMLLDGVPIYNASHLFGFFSVFNSDAIKDVKLIKGGFPARYGGRLSSVMEINMKEGHQQEYHGSVSLGLISSKAAIEGPINKKTSFLISGRRTYLDILLQPLLKRELKKEGLKGGNGYYFYDLNAKINHRISDTDKLYFSAYLGRDKFYSDLEEIEGQIREFNKNNSGWGNKILALRWNHQWSPKLFSNTTLTYSNYDLNFLVNNGIRLDLTNQIIKDLKLDYLSGIYDFGAKIDFDFLPSPNHFIKYGISGIHHTFNPGVFKLEQNDIEENRHFTKTIKQNKVKAAEFAAYVEDDIIVNNRLKMNVGIHLSGFLVKKKFYPSIQPRLNIRYLLPHDVAIKGYYSTMQQYIQLLAFEGIGLPTDLWLPTTDRVKPQNSWQVALGISKTLENGLDISIEGYYKRMNNVLSYKEGEGLFAISDWQDRVTQGKGWSYGAEFLIQKKTGKLTGWFGYTLSWTNRQFDDINNGEVYPYRYDRRHDISIVASYALKKNIDISGTWVYGTGNAITLEQANYLIQYYNMINPLSYYGKKNSYRMAPYHRLDIGINFKKIRKGYTRVWSVGTYNTYNRKNPFFLYWDNTYSVDPQGNTKLEKKLIQQSIFPIIPYVTYKINF